MDKLALLGGEKAVKLNYNEVGKAPKVPEKGIEKVVDMMRRGEISISPVIEQFEGKFSEYLGSKYALCHNNGTSTLIAAMYAIGVGPGDEVIVPSFSFWATASCVLIMNGTPIFCDVEPDTYNLDPIDIERKITPRTKAIVLVHIFGNPANMDEIMGIAKKYGIKVIEDCSHAHGATWRGKKLGTIGDIGCFSLQNAKLVSAGEGGMFVTDNLEYYQRAVTLGHYEKIQTLSLCEYSKYSFTGMGYKFRPHPLGIAIAQANLEILDEMNELRNKNAMYLEKSIENIQGLIPQKVYDVAVRQYAYQYVKYCSEKFENVSMLTFLKALKAEGVEYSLCGHGKYHKAPLFLSKHTYANGKAIPESDCNPSVVLPVSEHLADTTFMIAPRFETNCIDLIDQYIYAYQKVAGNIGELVKYEKEHCTTGDMDASKLDLLRAITKFRQNKRV